MSDKDVLPLEKEVALLRKKLFEGRQIDNHIVCLNAAKVRVQCGGQLSVGGRTPEDISAYFEGILMAHCVMDSADERVIRKLPARLDAPEFIFGESRQIFIHRSRDGRHCPRIAIKVADLAFEIKTNAPDIFCLGQRQH